MRHTPLDFSELLGKTIMNINGKEQDEVMTFLLDTGETYQMSHYQDCCEQVYIEDIVGDINDVVGSPILLAEEAISHDDDKGNFESITWTFYHLSTIKGGVTIRWCGSSNGYYSESVDFERVNNG
jgi:hypothetical protein